jgi:hypothetical protein
MMTEYDSMAAHLHHLVVNCTSYEVRVVSVAAPQSFKEDFEEGMKNLQKEVEKYREQMVKRFPEKEQDVDFMINMSKLSCIRDVINGEIR